MQYLAKSLSSVLSLAILALLAFGAPAEAQKKKKGESRTFEDTASVVVVEIPVTVTGKDGEPVPNLTQADFEVLDGKKEQEIIAFEMVDLSKVNAKQASIKPIPIAARRHFMMLFDMAYSDPESVVKAREAAMDVLDSFHPTDLVAVATFTSTRGTQFILNFTSDRQQAKLAIETLGVPELIDRVSDPLNLTIGQLSEGFGTGSADGQDGRAASAIREAAAAESQTLAQNVANAEKSEQRQRARDMTRNLGAVASALAAIDGQKHVLYFSEGIPDDLIVGRAGLGAAGGGGIGTGDIASNATDNLGSTGAEGVLQNFQGLGDATGDTRTQNALSDMVEAFNRAGCTIQAIDIGGLRASQDLGRAGGKQAMTSMAKDTGGEIYDNFNDLSAAMEQMLEATSVTYLLAIQPAKLKLDGEYHKLRVRLKEGRGMRVNHRAGYYSPKPDAMISSMERQLQTAEKILEGEEVADFSVDVLTAVVPVKHEKAYVPLLVEIDGPGLLEGNEGDVAELEVYAYALDENGSVFDFATQNLGLDLTQVRGQIEATGIKYWGHLDLPPGDLDIRVMVRNARTGRAAVQRVPLTVLAEGEGGLWPPMIAEPPTKWLMAREGADQQRDVPFPFMNSKGEPYIPAANAEVPKKGVTPILLQAFNLGEGDMKVVGQVLTSDGAPVSKASFELSASKAWKGGIHTGEGELTTSGLEPGEYILMLTAEGEGGTEHVSSVRFTVGS